MCTYTFESCFENRNLMCLLKGSIKISLRGLPAHADSGQNRFLIVHIFLHVKGPVFIQLVFKTESRMSTEKACMTFVSMEKGMWHS